MNVIPFDALRKRTTRVRAGERLLEARRRLDARTAATRARNLTRALRRLTDYNPVAFCSIERVVYRLLDEAQGRGGAR
jgi:hypothetical protein